MNDLLPMIFIPLLAAGVADHVGLRNGTRREQRARRIVSNWRKEAATKDASNRLNYAEAVTLRECARQLEEAMGADIPGKEAR